MEYSLFDIENFSLENLNSDKEINLARLEYALNLGKNLSYCPLQSTNTFHKAVMMNYLKMSKIDLLSHNRAKEIPHNLAKYDRLFIIYIICSHIWSDKKINPWNNSNTNYNPNAFSFHHDRGYIEYLKSFNFEELNEISRNIGGFFSQTINIIFSNNDYSPPDYGAKKLLWETYYEELKEKDIEHIFFDKRDTIKYSFILKLAYDNNSLYQPLLIRLKHIRELYTLSWTSLLLHLEHYMGDRRSHESERNYIIRKYGVTNKTALLWKIMVKRLWQFSLRTNQPDPYYIVNQNDLNDAVKCIINGFQSIKKSEVIWSKLMKSMTDHYRSINLRNKIHDRTLNNIKIAILIYLSDYNKTTIVTPIMLMLKVVNNIQ